MEPEEGRERREMVVEIRWKARWNDRGVGVDVEERAGVRASLLAFVSLRRMASTKRHA